MAEHAFGSQPKSNGQLRTPSPVGRATAPVVGVERTTIGSAADIQQRGTTAVGARQKKPSFGERFEEDPLLAIGTLLQEVSAGLKGTEGPSVKAQALQFQKDAQTLKAIKFGLDQADKFPEGSRDALISTIGNISDEAAAVLKEVFKAKSEEARARARALTEAIIGQPDIFVAMAKYARVFGLEEARDAFGPIAAKLAEQGVLKKGRVEEAGDTAEAEAAGKAAGTPPEVKTKVVKFRDEEGNQVTTLIDSDTGKTIKEIGRGPTVVFQPPKEPGTKAKNLIETGLVEGVEAMARLQNTLANFKPEFLQIFPRLKVKGLKAAEKLGFNISKANKATITAYSAWTRDAIENLNLGIKFLTGAQMSEPEADRLRKGFPDPENDAPTEFLAKLNSSIDRRAATMLRFDVLRKQGLDGPVTDAIARSMPLARFLPPADEPDAILLGADNEGNPIFRRPDGTHFKVTP